MIVTKALDGVGEDGADSKSVIGEIVAQLRFDGLQLFANAVYRSRTQTPLAEVDPYFAFDCGVSSDLLDRRLSLFLNVNDLFGTVRTGGSSVNPYNPSVSESTTDSRYVSFGLTWRIGRTEMEAQQTHGKKEPKKKGKQIAQ